MSISNMSVLVGGTITASAGTATSVISKGIQGQNHPVILDDASNFDAQTTIVFTAKEPKISDNAPNGYTQKRSSFKILSPLALDNLKKTVNTASFSISVDPETTAAELEALKVLAAQCIMDTDFSDFYEKQALS
jgi:hypothetical protein